MLDMELDVQDAISLNRRPHLPPMDSDATDNLPPMDLDAADKDEDVGRGRGPPGFATRSGPPITTITAVRATGYMSPQAAGGGYYAAPPQAQHIQVRIGMRVIHVVLTSQTDIPARHALNI